MGELIFILLMAGMVYPFKQLPPVPGMKSRWRSFGFLATGKECSLGAFERASQSSSVSQVDYIVEWLYLKEIFKW